MTRDLFARVGVVLQRPKSPGNVGSVARAMKNMGFSRLIVADPIAYDDPGHFDLEARRMAWNASDLLEQRQTVAGIDAALEPFTFVAGTSSNPVPGARVLSPRETAACIADALSSDPSAGAALLFGQEDIGLTREQQARCNVIATIPSSAEYPSLNLSQAALLFLYELRLALDSGPVTGDAPRPDVRAPSHGQVEAFYGRLALALERIDFFQGTGRDHMMREMRRIFNRASMTERELAILEGLVHRILLSTRRHG